MSYNTPLNGHHKTHLINHQWGNSLTTIHQTDTRLHYFGYVTKKTDTYLYRYMYPKSKNGYKWIQYPHFLRICGVF